MEILEIEALLRHTKEHSDDSARSPTFARIAADAARHDTVLRRSQLNAAVHGDARP